MQTWLLPTLSDVFLRRQATKENNSVKKNHSTVTENQLEQNYSERKRLEELKAQREWFGAIAALEKILVAKIDLNQSRLNNYQGLIFAAPAPILSNVELITRFKTGIFTPDAFNARALMPSQMPDDDHSSPEAIISPITELPLLPKDPIASEQFCLLLTAHFALVMVLGEDAEGIPTFHFSFEPELIEEVWAILRSRLLLTNYHQLEQLDRLIEQFAPPTPDYRLVSEFTRQLLKHLPDLTALAISKTRPAEKISIPRIIDGASKFSQTTTSEVHSDVRGTAVQVLSVVDESERGFGVFRRNALDSQQFSLTNPTVSSKLEMELLQALTHEIRTPLTTIRTLTRLLLKRKEEFKPNVIRRLQAIDQECSEQIDRMELIFRAAELESTSPTAKSVQLIPFPLEEIFEQSIPRWQKQAERRNVDLDVILPKQLPKVVSDPTMLDRALTGLMESCTRSLTNGGHIRVKVSTAGNQLKLQVLSQYTASTNPLKSLGQLLMFQPETGCLSLNLNVTKNIFQALGGKLTIRQRPHQGEELTIFLPIKTSRLKIQNGKG
ncbi:HAMP domain-containing histidine kinase [Pleurocapsales cyanobacterium LEGE 06147]|nr:HAMP domain-containing histidine kinase [Pleurocapsales cyanobacterium LEGE 06147]